MPKADAVFEGGGVRGIAHAGALVEAEDSFGYEWQNVAGTSAGAIIAALIAVGYSGREVSDIISDLDFTQLMDKAWEDRVGEVLLGWTKIIPKFGRVIPYLPSLFKDLGMYEGKRFQELVQGYFTAKGKQKYSDLLMPGFEDDPISIDVFLLIFWCCGCPA